MKNKITLVFSALLSSISAAAETIPGELGLPENLLMNAIQPFLQKISLFVGGIFGLYLILALMQARRERQKIKLLQDIRNDLDLLTVHFGVKHSHPKRNIFRRILSIFGSDSEESEKKKRK